VLPLGDKLNPPKPVDNLCCLGHFSWQEKGRRRGEGFSRQNLQMTPTEINEPATGEFEKSEFSGFKIDFFQIYVINISLG